MLETQPVTLCPVANNIVSYYTEKPAYMKRLTHEKMRRGGPRRIWFAS